MQHFSKFQITKITTLCSSFKFTRNITIPESEEPLRKSGYFRTTIKPLENEVKQAWLINFNTQEKIGVIHLSSNIFGAPFRRDLLHNVVVWQRAGYRAGTHKTKRVGEIAGSGRKPHPQKHTGKARQGHRRAPHMPGGYKPHGPVLRDFSIDIPRKVRQTALKVALSVKFHEGNLVIVDYADLKEPKTKELRQIMDNFKWKSAVLLVGESVSNNLRLASSNIYDLVVLPQKGANVYTILSKEKLVITLDALKMLEERLTKPTRSLPRPAKIQSVQKLQSVAQ